MLGTLYENRCSVDLTQFLSLSSNIFYDLYYVDDGKETASLFSNCLMMLSGALYPVPVKLLNYRINGNRVNVDSNGDENLDQRSIVLHRRFFMVDNLSSRLNNRDPPIVIVYAKSVVLRWAIAFS
jgi:hypothetical protein